MNEDRVFSVVILDVDGHRTAAEWSPVMSGDTSGLLALLQLAVGGYVEVVQLSSTLTMWVNEEGAFSLPVNLYAKWFGSFYNWDVRFFGDVVLTGGDDAEGNTLSLTKMQVEDILAWPWPRVVETVNLPGLAGENDEEKRSR